MDKTTKKIIRDLAKHRPRDRIISEVCETYRLQWGEAERLVEKIETDHTFEINSRQKPFFILLGVLTGLIGLLLSVTIAAATLDGLLIFQTRLPIPYLGNLIFFGLGILALIGGIKGVIRILKE